MAKSQRIAAPVLIADDNPDLAETLVLLVKSLGYDAVAVHDGQEAVWWCQALRPEVVILDINMPRLDGCVAAEKIRASDFCPKYIAAHTALLPDCEPLKSHSDLFEEVLPKPIDLGRLADMLKATLQLEGGWDCPLPN